MDPRSSEENNVNLTGFMCTCKDFAKIAKVLVYRYDKKKMK